MASKVVNESSQDLYVFVSGSAPQRVTLFPGQVSSPVESVHAAESNVTISNEKGWALGKFNAHVIDGKDGNLEIFGWDISPETERPRASSAENVQGAAKFAEKKENEHWVTVLGAGVAGLTAAHELVERGFRVQVVDKACAFDSDFEIERGPKESAFALAPRSVDVGGLARSQWGTAPLESQESDQHPSELRTLFGHGNWYAKPEAGGPLRLGFEKDGTIGTSWFSDFQTWLAALSPDSFCALQAVALVFPRSATSENREGLEAAYKRLQQFKEGLKRATENKSIVPSLENVPFFPPAMVEVQPPQQSAFVETTGTFVGLLIRAHASLGVIAGEHGYRFFPGFYRHLRDTMKRTPLFDDELKRFTDRSAHDNLREIEWQVVFDGSRERPVGVARGELPTLGHLYSQYRAIRTGLGYRASDLMRLGLRMLRYAASSSERRAGHYENITWWDFVSVRHLERYSATPGERLKDDSDKPVAGEPEDFRLVYGPRFRDAVRRVPQALVSMKSTVADARTQGNVWTQLSLSQFGLVENIDSTLVGPTSDAWFQHWRRYLEKQGVKFFLGNVVRLKEIEKDGVAHSTAPAPQGNAEAKRAPRFEFEFEFPDRNATLEDGFVDPAQMQLGSGTHHYVCALDAVSVSRVIGNSPPVVQSGVLKTLAPNSRFLSVPTAPGETPISVEEYVLDCPVSSRFQTMMGVQFYYDERVSFANGHVYYANAPLGISAISQVQYWGQIGAGAERARMLSNLSLDIGSWRTFDSPDGRTKNPSGLSPQKLADEILLQMAQSTPSAYRGGPAPRFFHLDDNIVFTDTPGEHATRNLAPYLVNIVGDWNTRPHGEPFSPTSARRSIQGPIAETNVAASTAKGEASHLWSSGGYLVHWGHTVFAGTHMRTFTRLSTMESANESARHAVNAILAHLTETAPTLRPREDELKVTGGRPDSPFQVATPFGDYCSIWDPERNESPDMNFLRAIDGYLWKNGTNPSTQADDLPVPRTTVAPHLFDILRVDEVADLVEDDSDALRVFELLSSSFSAFQSMGGRDVSAMVSGIDGLRGKFMDALKEWSDRRGK